MLAQKLLLFDDIDTDLIYLEDYILSSGINEPLYTLDLSKCYGRIRDILSQKSNKSFFIKSHEFCTNQIFPRPRPITFYRQLKKANLLIDLIVDDCKKFTAIPVFSVPENYLSFSYDGVHYTKEGHNHMFLWLSKYIFNV